MFKSIKTKLLWSHIGAVLFVNLILGIIGNRYLSQYLLSTELEQLKHSSSHSAEIIENTLRELAFDLNHMSDSQVVLNYLDNYRDLALQEHFTSYQKKFPKIAFLNEEGVEEFKIINDVTSEQNKKSHSPDLINRLISYPDEVIIFAAGTDPDLNTPTVRMALAKSHYFGNKFAGIISVSIPYEYLIKKISTENFDPTSFLILSDSKQNALSAFSSEENTKEVTIQYSKTTEPFPLSIAATLQDKDAKRRIVNNVDSLVSSTRIKVIDLNIQAVVPYATIHAKLNKIRNSILIALIFILFLTALLSYFIARQITNPITRLIQFSRKVAGGQKETKIDIDVTSKDEIAELVNSFQKMMTSISQSTVSRDYLDNIIASMSENVLVVNDKELITTMNKAAAHLFSASVTDQLTPRLSDIFAGKNLQLVREMIQDGVCQGEIIIYDAKGSKRHLLLSATPIPGLLQGSKEVVLVSTDISYLKEVENKLAEKQNYLTSIMLSMPAGLMVVDADSHIIIDVNPAACGMFASPREHLVGKVCHQFICPTETGQCPVTNLSKTLSATERSILTKDGKEIPVLKSVERMQIGSKNLLVESFVDISQRKEMEEALKKSQLKLKELAITDELTGLYNRRGFMTLSQKLLQIANRTKKELSLLYADLDNMKGINDELGHQNGDLALQDASEILKRFCRESDIISRIGGDEFAVLLTGSDNETAIVKRLEKEIKTFNDNSERPYSISISIGIASCHPNNETCEITQFMSQADNRMYDAKKAKQVSAPST
jgi:diguanylate cyclase (GGDEF)-like protein/PAS domain S-box-containing protein